jgi:hypothetical protein
MVLLRPLGILLLIVAILPWGAWTGARVAPLAAVVAAVELDKAGVSAEAPRAGTDMAARGCRSGVVPGACEVKALAPEGVAAATGGGALVLWPAGAIHGEGLAQAPPRDPPRGARV